MILGGPQGDLKIDGYDDQLVSYHIKLLCEAKLLEGQSLNEMGPNGFRWWATGLTWDGHEFLDAARDETRWKKAKNFVIDKMGSLMFEALKITLIQGIKSQLI